MSEAWQRRNGRRECPFFAQKIEKGQLITCFKLSPCLEYKIEAAQISRLECKCNAYTEAFFNIKMKFNVKFCLLALQSCRNLKGGAKDY